MMADPMKTLELQYPIFSFQFKIRPNKRYSSDRVMLLLFLKLECCGSSNYTDWKESEWKQINTKKEVPLSCCKEGKDISTCNNATGFNSDNIHTKVMLWYSFLFTRSHART